MKQFSEKTIDFLRWILIAGIVALFILAFMACRTSPEVQGDACVLAVRVY